MVSKLPAAALVRVALLTNIPAPYRLDFFRRLSERCDLRVIFDSKSEPNRSWHIPDDLGFDHCYVAGFAIPQLRRRRDGGPIDRRYLQVRFGILPALQRFRPDVVISIEFGLRSMQAALYCGVHKIPLILWSEGTPHSEGWQTGIRRRVRRGLVKRATRFWTNGIESAQLVGRYGANFPAIDKGMIGVNTEHLAGEIAANLPLRSHTRASLGLRRTVFLFSGQLIARKGLRELLSAIENLKDRAADFSLVILGDGELKAVVERWKAAHPAYSIVLLGFRQPAEVPALYAAADAFVMPTLDDNWSLVALEAAVAGLPQLFSKYNGATADLQRMGAPGVVIDPLDAAAFAAALLQWLDAAPTRAAGHVTSALTDYYGPLACAERAAQSLLLARAG